MNIYECSQRRAFMDDATYRQVPWLADAGIPVTNRGFYDTPNWGWPGTHGMTLEAFAPTNYEGELQPNVIVEVPGGGALMIDLQGPDPGPEFMPYSELHHITRVPLSAHVNVKGNGNPLYRDPGPTQHYANYLDCAPGMVTERAHLVQQERWGKTEDLSPQEKLVLERPMPSIMRAPVFPDETAVVVKEERNTAMWILAGLAAAALLS